MGESSRGWIGPGIHPTVRVFLRWTRPTHSNTPPQHNRDDMTGRHKRDAADLQPVCKPARVGGASSAAAGGGGGGCGRYAPAATPELEISGDKWGGGEKIGG
jgi:hypothetical protein